MAIYIRIIKIKEENFIHYYSVHQDLEEFICYLGIAPKEKKIYVSKNLKFENKTMYYEMDKLRPYDMCGEGKGGALARAIIKARNAIKDNEFPYEISWCA